MSLGVEHYLHMILAGTAMAGCLYSAMMTTINVYAHYYSSDTVDENDHRNMTMMLVIVMLLLVTTS